MIPRTLSATSIGVAENCMSRWEAEFFHRGKGIGNAAAQVGSAVHGALEMYVQNCIMKSDFPATMKVLSDFYAMSYTDVFGTSDRTSDKYLDGLDLLKQWHKRTSWEGVEVVTCEVKETFGIKTSAGVIPFNYILDRFDRLGPNEYRVMDYKTNAWGLNPADLKKKVQARAYSLAMRIKYPEAERIWVEFDMLRHGGPVGISFTREDDAETYRYLQRTAERIIAIPEGQGEETLNPECNFCPKKASCGALSRNIATGGIFSLADPKDLINRRAEMEFQRKAIGNLISEMDTMILEYAKEHDVMEMESDSARLRVGISSRRAVDAERVEHVIGPELFNRVAGKSMTMGAIDKLLKGDELTDEQKRQVKSLIYQNQGEPRVSVESRSPFGGI